ncbi:MAG: TGS domain-containing protein, partial [Rothia sp. (in: high G+C Gram-positive bacteria)]|uniref:TGS domain-containing protein n=1 Tax=Rothia sp. (in: high G+C Gram-positive bacteria) TaxID=1885016 RepID=UPI0026E04DEE
LYASEIMVFTPKGELKSMPLGSTALDFAFSIHSFLGSHCFGAKVNHRLVPLSYVLKSGDQVEILTTRTSHISAEWLGFATTAKARGKIQAYLRRESRDKQVKGEGMLRDFLQQHSLTADAETIDRVRHFQNLPSTDELYYNIGDGLIQLDDALLTHLQGRKETKGWRRFIPFMGTVRTSTTPEVSTAAPDLAQEGWAKQLNRKQLLPLTEEILAKSTLCPHCAPIPGDDVMGYITDDGQLIIHKRTCDEAVKLKTRYGNNIIACSWDMHKQQLFDVTIRFRGIDAKGVLYAIADVLHKLTHFIIKSITLTTDDGIFEGHLTISVYDTTDVATVCDSLLSVENVTEANRV